MIVRTMRGGSTYSGLWLGGMLEQQRGLLLGVGSADCCLEGGEGAVFLLVPRAFSTTRCPKNVEFDRFSGQYYFAFLMWNYNWYNKTVRVCRLVLLTSLVGSPSITLLSRSPVHVYVLFASCPGPCLGFGVGNTTRKAFKTRSKLFACRTT